MCLRQILNEDMCLKNVYINKKKYSVQCVGLG